MPPPITNKANWIQVHKYDEEVGGVVLTLVNMDNVEKVHVYVPTGASDWRYALGIRTEFHLINGTIRYCVETMAQINVAIDAVEVV